MITSNMIVELCEKLDVSISELPRHIGQSPQNFNKKLQRGTVSFGEMTEIADVVGVTYEQTFVLKNGERIQIKSE